MADARALLRAHRAENRIKHPHAAYSDAGKLLCKLCHEAVKSESLWDGHIRGQNHRRKLQELQSRQQAQTDSTPTEDGGSGTNNKRKHDDADEAMSDVGEEPEEALRKKRNRTDMNSPAPISTTSSANGEKDKDKVSPPLLSRRTSGTPVQGVEIAIPSRPATPLAGSNNSNTSTPRITPMGRSPLIGSSDAAAANSTTTTVTQLQKGREGANPALPISTETLAVPLQNGTRPGINNPPSHTNKNITTAAAAGLGVSQTGVSSVDETEWAAFEAEMAAAEEDPQPPQEQPNHHAYAATISAPAMTSAEVEAKSQEEAAERRKRLLDVQTADEREDATRALEAEFEEMEELEGRVRRLKEMREQVRARGSVANLKGAGGVGGGGDIPSVGGKGIGVGVGVGAGSGVGIGKENGGDEAAVAAAVDEDDGEEDDDEDEDEWDGFRFRA
ncbi:hypothetical protein F4778DRAFT_525637 [Xylariomycetidae sp. FL2044]|nr:hypothetical protein F4778DRAFT_525637 [Xylariomycetidae sp. FL2044]